MSHKNSDCCMEIVGIEHFFLGTPQAEIGVKIRMFKRSQKSKKESVNIFVTYPQEQHDVIYFGHVFEQEIQILEERQELVARFALKRLAVYRPEASACILPQGRYGIFVGTRWKNAVCGASLFLTEEIVVMRGDYPQLGAAEERADQIDPPIDMEASTRGKPEIIINVFDVPATDLKLL